MKKFLRILAVAIAIAAAIQVLGEAIKHNIAYAIGDHPGP